MQKPSEFSFSFSTAKPWSPRRKLAAVGIGAAVLIIFAALGPGWDYFGAYSRMVLAPDDLQQVAQTHWTLNPTWMIPFMAPFVTLPGRAGYVLFMAATLAITIYNTRIFGGKPTPILLSSHIMWILWWGQLEGWGILALLLGWFAYKKESWPWMFLALSIASFKPQIGFVPVFALWWWSGHERWKSMAALVGLFLASLVIWGPWPLWYLQGTDLILGQRELRFWNASIGWMALPLFIPAVLIPMSREKRLIALTATAYLASPYLPYYSTILLLTFALPGWAYIFAFLGHLRSLIGPIAWQATVLLPVSVLIWLYWPFFKEKAQAFREGSTMQTESS